MIKKLFLVITLVILNGCANQTVKILDATWVSMKNSTPPGPLDRLTKVGPISEEYCLDKLSGSFGLMDEVVKKAEEKNKIDYIKYPSFSQTVGKACVQVAGEGFRILR